MPRDISAERSVAAPMRFIMYEIGDDDTIVSVGGDWEGFALENGAPTLLDVKGLPLFDFIDGVGTRQVYRELLARVREGHTVAFPFRCDSPDTIREMSMIMRPLEAGHVRFESFLLRSRRRAAQPANRLARPVRVCSWCKRVAVGEEWEYPEFAIEALSLFDRLGVSAIAHDICDECAGMLLVTRPDLPGTRGLD